VARTKQTARRPIFSKEKGKVANKTLKPKMPRTQKDWAYENYLWTIAQGNEGDPPQLLIQQSETDEFEVLLDLEPSMLSASSGSGGRRNKKYVVFGKYAFDRDMATTAPETPKELKKILTDEELDHRKCKGNTSPIDFFHVFN
jgi:hypothetical protein